MDRTAAGIYTPLPTELGGTRVWFDEVACLPILWSQSDEVAVIAPYEIAGRKEVRLRVEYGGASVLARAATSTASPGWVRAADGSIVARNQDGGLNSKERPAPPGTVVTAWATGEGQTDPPGVTGRRALELLPRPVPGRRHGEPDCRGDPLCGGGARHGRHHAGQFSDSRGVEAGLRAACPHGRNRIGYRLYLGGVRRAITISDTPASSRTSI